MKQLEVLDYLKLNGWQKFIYNLKCFFCGIPGWFANLFIKIGRFFKKTGIAIWNNLKDLYFTFVNGKWQTKVSFLIMGFGSICYGQALRGILFLLFEIIFVLYMVFWGGTMLSKFGLGDNIVPMDKNVYDEATDSYISVPGDDTFKVVLYGLLTILFIVALVYTWRLQIKQCRINEEIMAKGKKVKGSKEDLKSLLDDQYHKTLLALPVAGIVLFTVIPIIFMILVAFTNYNGVDADGYANAFHWVGLDNFNQLINFGTSIPGQKSFAVTVGEVLAWTLMWAVFATFTNYFLGMFVAMMINKKGIQFKKGFRTILVMTIAIPQFISLMYISQMFAYNGIINGWLMDLGIISTPIHFMDNQASPTLARAMVILINIWIGIPYLMLITTGILMNIPADLYESAKIDGASGIQQFGKITLPYMLFVTGPYLLTSFTGNLNNFNVIFLLTGGSPLKTDASSVGANVGDTDLLITWLFNMTTGSSAQYYMASVIGILIFIVVAVLSLIVYNVLPSNKNEGDFS